MVKFWWDIDFLWCWGIGCKNIFLWNFLVMWILVMEIDELNFYVVEPQESRQSPNVKKCIGSTVS